LLRIRELGQPLDLASFIDRPRVPPCALIRTARTRCALPDRRRRRGLRLGSWRGHRHRSPGPARDTHPRADRGRGGAAGADCARGRAGCRARSRQSRGAHAERELVLEASRTRFLLSA